MSLDNLADIIRSKVDIVDIIGEKIPLTAKGKNFFGVCPFHDDSNPSMCVSREKQIYTCFSCHATGNVYTFLMNYEHIDFKDALKYLGDRVGILVEGSKLTKKNSKYDKFYEAYTLALKYYQNNLNSQVGKEAKKYLFNRKITEEIIKEFDIGLSLDKKDDLINLLIKKGYDLATLNKIGLANEDNYDIYRDRIMFPLQDVSGKVVGFSGRIYQNNNQNKYLNTKETPIFKKGEMLYHYHIAKEECRLKKSVIVMEGFMDVIRASSIGIRNTVALMGTALTKEQILLLKRLSNTIILCLDGDDPGVHATLNIGEMLLQQELDVKVISLPNPDDPDTYILNNGKEKFENLLDAALNFSDYKILKLREHVDFQSDEEIANYINSVLKEIVKINDEIRVEVMLKRLAKEFDIGYNTLEMRLYSLKKAEEKPKIQPFVPSKVTKKDKYAKAIEQILYFMLNNDWVITEVEKQHLILAEEKYRKLCNEIIYYYKQNGFINVADFYTYASDKDDILVLLNDILVNSYNESTTKEDLYLYFQVVKDYSIKQEIKRLNNLMKKEVDPLQQASLAEKIRKLRIGE